MIIDYEHELTTKDGQAITATAYGTKSYDQKGAGAASVGEKLALLFYVIGADIDNLTSLDVALMADTDGAGAGEVTVLTKNYLLADLTVAKGVRCVGIAPPHAEKRYYRAKFSVNGANPSAGKVVAWLAKGDDVVPFNEGVTLS